MKTENWKFHYSETDLKELFGDVIPDCFKNVSENANWNPSKEH